MAWVTPHISEAFKEQSALIPTVFGTSADLSVIAQRCWMLILLYVAYLAIPDEQTSGIILL